MSKDTIADSNPVLQIREEQLDISKKQVQTGEVTMHTEVFTEERTIKVPVTREELVIEKKVMDGDTANSIKKHTETIRIPVSEERVEVKKHLVILEDVNFYKQDFQDNKHIEETLKKEKINIKTSGNPVIIEQKI